MWNSVFAIIRGAALGALSRWLLGIKRNALFPTIPHRELHPDGYDPCINVGEAAGQTVFQVHLIPRDHGDVAGPARRGARRDPR